MWRSPVRNRLASLQQVLDDRPEKQVVKYVNLDKLEEATREQERAFRSRQNAWQALSEVRVFHRERDPGQCQCGARYEKCKVAEIVDRYPALAKWEATEVAKLRRGQPSGLPENQIARLDARWMP